jgi:hypothetical protein
LTQRYGHRLLGFALLGLLAASAGAAASPENKAPLERDMTYEENLRWEASADKTITPTRVIRYMMGMRGSEVFASVTPAEFQPIVNVENTRVRAVATIAYRF